MAIILLGQRYTRTRCPMDDQADISRPDALHSLIPHNGPVPLGFISAIPKLGVIIPNGNMRKVSFSHKKKIINKIVCI